MVKEYRMTFGDYIGCFLRRSPVFRLRRNLRKAQKFNVPIRLIKLETHYLSGGNIDKLVDGLIYASQRNIDLTIDEAIYIDLSKLEIFDVIDAIKYAQESNLELSKKKAISIAMSRREGDSLMQWIKRKQEQGHSDMDNAPAV